MAFMVKREVFFLLLCASQNKCRLLCVNNFSILYVFRMRSGNVKVFTNICYLVSVVSYISWVGQCFVQINTLRQFWQAFSEFANSTKVELTTNFKGILSLLEFSVHAPIINYFPKWTTERAREKKIVRADKHQIYVIICVKCVYVAHINILLAQWATDTIYMGRH